MRITRTVQAVLLAVATVASVRPATGQTHFELADVEVDLSTYTNFHDCLGAVDRVVMQLNAEAFITTGTWPDTLPHDRAEARQPFPAIVGETSRTCLEATAEDAAAAPVTSWRVLANLYLHAGSEDSARAVVERRLAAVEPDSTNELNDLFTQIQLLYHGRGAGIGWTGVRPPVPAPGDDIVLSHIDLMPTLDRRLQVYMQMLITGGEGPCVDTAAGERARRLLARMSAQMDSLSDDDAQRMADRGLINDDMRMTVEKARDRLAGMSSFFVGRCLMLKEQLPVSTPAYSDAIRGAFSQASGEPPEAYPWPLGQEAPRLEGDVWLGCEEDPCEAYPRPGRVSIVAFHTPEAGTRTRVRERVLPDLLSPLVAEGGCAERAASLRHLQDRFPEIDIIVVARTWGTYHYAKEGITPESEAERLRECFTSHGLDRVILTMTETPGWRLPEPDGRLPAQPAANWTNYSFGAIWSDPDREQHGSDVIVDQDGYVLNAFVRRVERYSEEMFAEVIEVLLERGEAGT